MNFYKQAALALDHLDTKQGSVKGSVAAAGVAQGNESKRVLALVIESLKYKPTILDLLSSVKLLNLEKKIFPAKVPSGAPTSQNLVLVLLQDLLFSKEGKVQASDKWPPKAAILRHGTRLKAELVKLQIKRGLSSKEELERSGGDVATQIPRYVRCNTNILSTAKFISNMTKANPPWTLLSTPTYPVPARSFFQDPHLSPDLFALPASTKFDKNLDYANGGIILQDKASCFPAKVLMHDWKDGEGQVIDGTAAPGNKTTYISALMHNKGQVHAFERSHVRFKTLEKMLERAGCNNVKAQRADFMESKPKDYENVTRILLDPSCSGSGIVNRLDYLLEGAEPEDDDVKAERLEKLAAFQLVMIRHAMKFPNAKRIVYSTCSIHTEEDEEVVMKALESPEARDFGWKIAPRSQVLPAWERRGRSEATDGDKDIAEAVICCVPGEDRTNGFFVSCFVRDVPEYQPTEVVGRGKKRARHTDVEEEEAEPKRTKAEDNVEDMQTRTETIEVDTSKTAFANETSDQTTSKAKPKKKKKKAKKAGLGA